MSAVTRYCGPILRTRWGKSLEEDMSKKRVLIGLTLGVGFLVACGFVVGQPSVRVIQDAPPGPVSQLPATQPQQPVPGLAPADTNQIKTTRLTAPGQQPTAVSTE